jgi:hypothetical protein
MHEIFRYLGIESLGDEIMASLHALYGQEQAYRKASELELHSFSEEYQRVACGRLMENRRGVPPKVRHFAAHSSQYAQPQCLL